jgi:hypothetical protein
LNRRHIAQISELIDIAASYSGKLLPILGAEDFCHGEYTLSTFIHLWNGPVFLWAYECKTLNGTLSQSGYTAGRDECE